METRSAQMMSEDCKFLFVNRIRRSSDIIYALVLVEE